MTELRDARLRRALEHAPDTVLRPAPGTREAIKDMAMRAGIATPPPSAVPSDLSAWSRVWCWWRRPRKRSTSMPWNAAFATLALASLVTVMWYEQPVPPATQDDVPATAVGRDVAVATPPASAAALSTVPGAVVVPAPEVNRPLADSGQEAPRSKPSALDRAKALAKGDVVAGQDVREQVVAAPQGKTAPASRSEEPGRQAQREVTAGPGAAPLAERATAAARQADSTGAAEASPALARRSAPAPTPTPTPTPTAAPAPAPAAKAVSALGAISSAEIDKEKREATTGKTVAMRLQTPGHRVDWRDVDIQRAGTALLVSSAQTGRLLAALQSVALRNIEPGDPSFAEVFRLDFSRRGAPVGALELGARWLRWRPAGADPRDGLVGRASMPQWEAIQEELTRLGLAPP